MLVTFNPAKKMHNPEISGFVTPTREKKIE